MLPEVRAERKFLPRGGEQVGAVRFPARASQPFLTEKSNEFKGLAKGEKGEGVFPSLYIFYALSLYTPLASFLKKWSLTTLTFLTSAAIPRLSWVF